MRRYCVINGPWPNRLEAKEMLLIWAPAKGCFCYVFFNFVRRIQSDAVQVMDSLMMIWAHQWLKSFFKMLDRTLESSRRAASSIQPLTLFGLYFLAPVLTFTCTCSKEMFSDVSCLPFFLVRLWLFQGPFPGFYSRIVFFYVAKLAADFHLHHLEAFFSVGGTAKDDHTTDGTDLQSRQSSVGKSGSF